MKNRTKNLMPNGIPKWIRCYDNGGLDKGGSFFDRYTVCYTRKQGGGSYVAMSCNPFHPQGFGQHGEGKNGRSVDANKWGFAPMIGRKNHLGRRIPFSALPEDCRKLVLRDYREIWGIK